MPTIDSERLNTSLRNLDTGSGTDIDAAISEVVDAVVTLFQVKGSGLMIADEESSLHYLVASGPTSRLLENAESAAGEGPCVTAFTNNELVHADDLRQDSRWPAVRETFLREGAVAVLGVPVRIERVPVGTLDVFHDRPHVWDESERLALTRYADVIGTILAAALAARRAGELAGQLQYALDYRIVIERAVGYLMAQRRVDAVRAFDLLRTSARGRRRKVAEVARYLLDTGALPA
ncbi:GAF and ANTAR domain-containing protein [Catenuloplanes sp. NPDC051500]|uniref:GAF and ANTAR domain-containing protein n=1 Tax=Catenuloplanes sp. NPDC051500 TaxID=3363959 RepID=UPI003793B5A8